MQLSARRGNLATGERLLRACLDGLRQTQYGVLYTPFLGDLAEVLATAGDDSLAAAEHVQPDDGFYQPERADLPWQTDGSGVVFLQNDSGEAFLWRTNGTVITGAGSLGNPGPDWHVKATGDFNGDGNPDLLWQNDTGEGFIWELNGTTLISAGSIGNPGPSWHIISDHDEPGAPDPRSGFIHPQERQRGFIGTPGSSAHNSK